MFFILFWRETFSSSSSFQWIELKKMQMIWNNLFVNSIESWNISTIVFISCCRYAEKMKFFSFQFIVVSHRYLLIEALSVRVWKKKKQIGAKACNNIGWRLSHCFNCSYIKWKFWGRTQLATGSIATEIFIPKREWETIEQFFFHKINSNSWLS